MSRSPQYPRLPHCPSLSSQSFPHQTLLIDWSIEKTNAKKQANRPWTHPYSVVEWKPTPHPWQHSPPVNLEFPEHPIADSPFSINWDIFGPEIGETLVKLNMTDLAAFSNAIQDTFVGTREDAQLPYTPVSWKEGGKNLKNITSKLRTGLPILL